MTNRERLNRCSDKALVKFLLRQHGCIGCVVGKSCPDNPRSENYNPTKTVGICADRLLAWLKEESAGE